MPIYIKEYEELQKISPVCKRSLPLWRPPQDPIVKINFDATFKERDHKLGLGIVIKGNHGRLLGLRVVINNNVSSPFAA